MKKEFIGYYKPTEMEIENAWKNGIFAFDTNTLLNLYRYTETTRTDFIESLKSIKDKLFLPYQAAFEFHSNRLNVIENIASAYSHIETIFKEDFNTKSLNQINQYKNHPTIIIDNIIKLHSDFLLRVSKELLKQKAKHPDFTESDIVLNELTNLFDERIGKSFTIEELKIIYEKGKKRYEEQIPPGYKDSKNKDTKDDRNKFGDLIIWFELINLAKKEKKPVVFITDDRKEDWWRKSGGKTIRPREELIKEFYDETDIRILIYNADEFLKYAKQYKLIPKIKEKTINEIKKTRLADEKGVFKYNTLNQWSKFLKVSDLKNNMFTFEDIDEYNTLNQWSKFSKISDLKNNMFTLEDIDKYNTLNQWSEFSKMSDLKNDMLTFEDIEDEGENTEDTEE